MENLEKNDRYDWIIADCNSDQDGINFYRFYGSVEEVKKKLVEMVMFDMNEDKESWSYPHMCCTICFCNSGSRVPKIEQIFMQMFNYLAYESKLIKCEPLEDEKIK